MRRIIYAIIACLLFTSSSIYGYDVEKNNRFVNVFKDFLNNLPNQPYVYEDGLLSNTKVTGENTFTIDVSFKVSESNDPKALKLLKCSATIQDDEEHGTIILENGYQCHEDVVVPHSEGTEYDVQDTQTVEESPNTEVPVQQVFVKLVNEVQPDTTVTSGEQFIAIPRQPQAPCIGCSSFVNPTAAGVRELALLGLRHLDRHEPSVRHHLNTVLQVERQVQVVNGVRYILTLNIDYNNCSTSEAEGCSGNQICKISILEKPWVKLADGSKFRAILANNCTEEWIFGDGEVLPNNPENGQENKDKNNLNPLNNDEIRVVHNVDILAQPKTERTLTEEDLKALEEQIIPNIEKSLNIANTETERSIIPNIESVTPEDIASQPTAEPQTTMPMEVQRETAKTFVHNYYPLRQMNKMDDEIDNSKKLTNENKQAIDDFMRFLDDVTDYSKLKERRQKRGNKLVGGPVEKNAKDPIYRVLAEDSLAKYLQDSGNTQSHKVVSIEKVLVQVVAGTKTILDFKISPDNGNNGDVINCHSEVWEKPWMNFKEIQKVNCEISNRAKRENILGDPREKDAKDPKYRVLAEDSLAKYLQDSGITRSHKVVSIEKVLVQVVAGTKTILDFKISPDNGNDGDVVNCHSEVWEKSWMNFKEIQKVNCEISNRAKRGNKVGDPREKDAKDPKYKVLAEDSMAKYLQDSGITQTHKVVSIEKVLVQVVAGTKTILDFKISPDDGNNGDVINCHSEVWEKPWMNFKEIQKVNCKIANRVKRDINFAGGPVEKNAKDPIYRVLAEDSLAKYLQDSGNTQSHKVVSIEKVLVQVVAGTKTILDFKISPDNGNNGDVINCHSEVWEKPWMNFKEIQKVNCEISNRAKRENILGDPREKDAKDPKYRVLAEDSLAKYLQDSGITRSHKVVSIEKVLVQVVAGTKTILDFKISPDNGNDGDVVNCHSEVWEKSWMNFKEIQKVNCEISNRAKRGNKVGDPREKDAKDPKYKVLAEDSMAKYLQDSGITQTHKVVSIEKVLVQVVAGTKTILDFKISPDDGNNGDVINCHSEVWEKPWMNFKEIQKVNCKIANRVKRDINFAGGPVEKNAKDPIYRVLAEDSLAKYLQDSGNTQSHKVVSIEKVLVQVVAGTKTILDFKISPDNGNNGDVINCHSEVWEKPWMNFKEIQKVNCEISNRAKRENILGDPREKDAKDPKYKVLAEDSMAKYLQDSGITQSHKVVSIEKVLVQVVAGTKTILDFKISPDNGNDGDVVNCHSEVWEKPWMNFKEIQKVNCKIANRIKRDISFAGGLVEKNAKDPKYRVLAEDSLAKYLQDSGNTQSHKVVSIEKVFVQVVAGTITILDFKISPANGNDGDVVNCHSKVWEKPWMNFKEIQQVNCEIANRVQREIRFAGGPVEKNPKDPKYRVLAEDSLAKYLQDSGNTQSHKIVSIEKVLQQLIAGTKTILDFKISPDNGNDGDVINCHSEVWEKPWINFKEVLEVSCAVAVREKRSLKGSHHQQLVGEPHEVNLNANIDENFNMNTEKVALADPYEEFKSLAEEAVLKYQQEYKTKYAYHVLKIHRAKKQLVAGSLASIEFTIAPTECSPADDQELIKNCKLRKPKTKLVCHTEIFEKKWLTTEDAKQITVLCDKIEKKTTKKKAHHISKKLKRSIGAAITDDAYIQQLVDESIEKLNKDTSSKFMMRLLNIINYEISSATRRYTTIEFDAAYTDCRHYVSLKDIANCAIQEDYPHRHCISNIYPRPWSPGGRYISVNCEPEAHAEMHFHSEVANTTALLAEEALKHVEAKYPHPQKQQVVRVISHEKQLIAGIHHRLKLEIGYTDCLALSAQEHCEMVSDRGYNKFCRVNVWIQPGSDHPPNFRVTCDDQNDDFTREMHRQQQAETLFLNFLTVHKPPYTEDRKEMARRFQIFKDNIDKIRELNVHERGTAKYAVTRFADLTYEEFSKKRTGLRPDLKSVNQIPRAMAEVPDVDIPDAFDWREHGAVTEVKNQGSCGSCWAFSVTGNVEGQYKLKTGKLLSLSEQELVDCDKLDNGCSGGMPDNAYRAIEQLGGLETEADYPYEEADDKCAFNTTLTKVQISGAVNISSNETDMAKWLYKNGPISIGINANAMQFYVGGISHPLKFLCSPHNLDHGVLIVGYGVKNYPLFHKRLPYWIVKNSWGTTWGEQGYYRVYRGDGSCGLNLMSSSSIV